jgi:hypothetical protein
MGYKFQIGDSVKALNSIHDKKDRGFVRKQKELNGTNIKAAYWMYFYSMKYRTKFWRESNLQTHPLLIVEKKWEN